MNPDLDVTNIQTWPTLKEAAEELETSLRTIWRHSERGALEIRRRSRVGAKPESVCNPSDIAKLQPGPYIARTETQEAKHQAKQQPKKRAVTIATALKPVTIDALLQSLQTIATNVTASKPVTIVTKLWLTIDEAAAYSGIPRSYVKRYAKDGTIPAQRFGRAWRIRRAELEAFQGDTWGVSVGQMRALTFDEAHAEIAKLSDPPPTMQ